MLSAAALPPRSRRGRRCAFIPASGRGFGISPPTRVRRHDADPVDDRCERRRAMTDRQGLTWQPIGMLDALTQTRSTKAIPMTARSSALVGHPICFDLGRSVLPLALLIDAGDDVDPAVVPRTERTGRVNDD